jgi:hypothetical protein
MEPGGHKVICLFISTIVKSLFPVL